MQHNRRQWNYSPHGRNNAFESSKKHRGREVNRLIGLPVVALRGLTGAQEREERVREVERHEARNGEHAIRHHKTAIQRVIARLVAVACQVN